MLRDHAQEIIAAALKAAQPDTAVRKALDVARFDQGRIVLVAIGKAAFQMAKSAREMLDGKISEGIVITKYGHAPGPLPGIQVFEAGHPVPDENSFAATEAAMKLVQGLSAEDTVLFLVSGGGSALFEKPLIPPDELESITRQLLASGADIVEMNTIRKRLSMVKGGKFARLCEPARLFSIVLSDILGDPLDMIASGPAYPDSSTGEKAQAIIRKYRIALSDEAKELLNRETPKELFNATSVVTGSVRQLCHAAEAKARELGYEPVILTDSLCCTARDAGSFLASIARYHQEAKKSVAFLAGGETVVRLTGNGLGGRNQEIALAAAHGIDGLPDTAVFSFGSDGTDGPTDAAGGYVDGTTAEKLRDIGIDPQACLENNDSYHALKKISGLIMTGPTGTNVNDLSVVLVKR